MTFLLSSFAYPFHPSIPPLTRTSFLPPPPFSLYTFLSYRFYDLHSGSQQKQCTVHTNKKTLLSPTHIYITSSQNSVRAPRQVTKSAGACLPRGQKTRTRFRPQLSPYLPFYLPLISSLSVLDEDIYTYTRTHRDAPRPRLHPLPLSFFNYQSHLASRRAVCCSISRPPLSSSSSSLSLSFLHPASPIYLRRFARRAVTLIQD